MLRWRQIPWRDKPTDRQKVICERLAEKVKEETGQIVDPEAIRAVRYTTNAWPGLSCFEDRDELEILTIHAKLNRKRERLLSKLAELEGQLYDHMAEFDDTEDEEDDFDV